MDYPHSITSTEVREYLNKEYPGEAHTIDRFITENEGLDKETEYLEELAKDPTFTVWGMWHSNSMDAIETAYVMFQTPDEPTIISA